MQRKIFILFSAILALNTSLLAGIADKRLEHLWPEGKIMHELDANLSKSQIQALNQARNIWFGNTREEGLDLYTYQAPRSILELPYCVRFVSGPKPKVYLPLVGRPVIATSKCHPIIVPNDINQEALVRYLAVTLGHLIGFYAEHNRPDRDDHITIYRNIPESRADEFKKLADDAKRYQIFGDYDPRSIMHFPTRSPDIEGPAVYLLSKENVPETNLEIKQTITLSQQDKIALAKLYAPILKIGRVFYSVCGPISREDQTLTLNPPADLEIEDKLVSEYKTQMNLEPFVGGQPYKLTFKLAPHIKEALISEPLKVGDEICAYSTSIIQSKDFPVPTIIVERMSRNYTWVEKLAGK